jgi:hypothetical protein
MLRKLQVASMLLCMLSYAAAGTVSIGTASARGDIRVDSYSVKGNATLFDGSVVETGQATADLRLGKGTEITLATASRGTVYSDRLVLQHGQSELTASNSFQLEANGLRVTPNEPNSRGVVSLMAGNTVEVASLNGSFGVTNDHGVLLANVGPGHIVSFAMMEDGDPTTFSGVGVISYGNGQYYLETSGNAKYLLTCKDLKKYIGDKVFVNATLQRSSAQTGGVTSTLCVKSVQLNVVGPTIGSGMPQQTKLIIAGVAVAGGVGAVVAIAEVNHSSVSASK